MNELGFSDSISLSFITCITVLYNEANIIYLFVATLRKVIFKHGTRDENVKNRNVQANFPTIFLIKYQINLQNKKNARKKAYTKLIIIIVT